MQISEPSVAPRANVVIIGGGVAGLAAAAYLARGGAAVSVLEKAPALGGRAISDSPGGFALNRGNHALYTGGAASDVLRELGVRYTAGIPRDVWALDGGELHTFPVTPLQVLRVRQLRAADKADLIAAFVRLSMQRASTLGGLSIAEWIAASAKRPKVRRLLSSVARVNMYSSALDLISADVFVARLQQTMKYPVHYVDGGWQTLVDGLLNAATAAGARVLTSASAAALQVHDGLVRAVTLSDGTTFACDQLVVATEAGGALDLLRDQPHADLERILHEAVAAQDACLDVALHDMRPLGYPVIFDLQQNRFVSVQSRYARLAPAGGSVIHAVKQLDPRVHTAPDADRADLEAMLDLVQPGWQLVTAERRFLPKMTASSLLPLVRAGGLAGRAPHRSRDIANLYFAGDWVGRDGYLVDTSLASARESAHQLLHASQTDRDALLTRAA